MTLTRDQKEYYEEAHYIYWGTPDSLGWENYARKAGTELWQLMGEDDQAFGAWCEDVMGNMELLTWKEIYETYKRTINCMKEDHPNAVVLTSGGPLFVAGEYTDDTREELYCPVCKMLVEPKKSTDTDEGPDF